MDIITQKYNNVLKTVQKMCNTLEILLGAIKESKLSKDMIFYGN